MHKKYQENRTEDRMIKELFTLTEVSRILQLSKSTLYKYVELDLIPSYKVGNRIRFSQEEIELWVAEKKNTTGDSK